MEPIAPTARPARPAVPANADSSLSRAVRALVALLLVTLLFPAPAAADGFSDWGAGALYPGTISLVPSLQLRLRPITQVYVQGQLQVGLAERVDLIVTPAAWISAAGVTFDATWLQPRVQVAPGLSLSPGVSLQGDVDGLASGWLPGAFLSLGDRWGLNLNVIATLPFEAPSHRALFVVVVVDRELTAAWSVFSEVDVWHVWAGASGSTVDVYAGVQRNLGPAGSVNVSLTMPVRPALAPSGLGIGLWWSVDFGVRPLLSRSSRATP